VARQAHCRRHYLGTDTALVVHHLLRSVPRDFCYLGTSVSLERAPAAGGCVSAASCLLIVSSRRLYEHVAVIRPSQSKMWFAHWLLGLSFYVCMSIAVWVEGSEAIIDKNWAGSAMTRSHACAKAAVGVPAFLAAWAAQYRCHAYLAALRKYSLPDSGMFRRIVCPHYTCECILYLSLAVIAAPRGHLCNRTLLCAAGFVAINLGVTANGTKRWYIGKFGPEKVAKRWRMVPFVF